MMCHFLSMEEADGVNEPTTPFPPDPKNGKPK